MNKKIISNNLFVMKYLFRQAPGYVLLSILVQILNGLPDVLTNVVLVSFIINTIFYHKDPKILILAFIGYSILITVVVLLDSVKSSIIQPIVEEKLSRSMQYDLYQKIESIDMEEYDNPEFYNDYILALKTAKKTTLDTFNNITTFIGKCISIALVAGILSKIDVVMLILVVFAVILSCSLNTKTAELQYKKSYDLQPYIRRRDYISRIFYQYEHAKELRTTSISQILKQEYSASCNKIRQIYRKYNKKLCGYSVIQSYIPNIVIINFMILLYMGYKIVVKQNARIGDFVTVYNGVENIYGGLYFILGVFHVKFRENGKYIGKFRELLDYTPKMKDTRKENTGGISALSLEHVKYRYPDSDNYSIDDVSLSIETGKKIAIVGYNGAGKSTLIKLLVRLYDPSHGKIRKNSTDIRDIGMKQYREDFSVLFQDYQIYAASIAENISVASLDKYVKYV